MKIIKIYFYLLAISLLTINTFAQDGTLDPTFGVGGIVEIEQGSSVISQHKSLPNNQSLILTRRGSLLKVNEDGSLDNTFGDNGVVNLKDIVGSHDSLTSQFNDFDFTSTGEIVIGGASDFIDSIGIFLVVVKLNENGDVNRDFGENGVIKIFLEQHTTGTAPLFRGNGRVAITQNDKIIVTKVEYEVNPPLYVRLIRLNSNGTIDNSFGTDGSFTNEFRYTIYENRLQMDIYGNIFYGEGYNIAKVLETGILDTTFGDSGYFSYNNLRVYDIDFQSDGKIIGTFQDYSDGYYPVIGRLSQNGLIDSSFGLNGFMNIHVNTDNAIFRNSIITNEDDIISAGYSFDVTNEDFENTHSILTKLSHNGNYIEDFGDNGKVDINLYPDSKEYQDGLFINPENYNITIFATREQAEYTYSILLARFNNSKTLSNIHVSGNVSGIWDVDTVYVNGDITIPVNEELTIKPNTYVYFTGEYKFDVFGTLTAKGTERDSIFFASDSLGEISSYPYYAGFWYGITFHSTDENGQTPSSLDYCNIKYAFPTWLDEMSNRYGGGLIFYKSEIDVKHTSFTDCLDENLDKGVFTSIHSKGNIDGLSFLKTTSYRAGTITLLSSDINIENLYMNDAYGIYVDSSKIIIKNSTLDNCSPYIQWGIVNSENSEVEMVDCEITNNNGIGIFAKFSEFKIEHTLIKNNSKEGGLFIESPSTFTNCEIIENGSTGLRFQSTQNWGTTFTSEINNCVIAKNNLSGLRFLSRNNANIVNTTIADNTNSSGWGGVINGEVATHLNNCIVWNNGNDLDFQAGGLYTYSIIQGNYVGSDTATTNLQNVDPLFRDATNGDYHLQSTACGSAANSPGIDTGDPNIGDLILNCESGGLGTKLSDIGAYGGEGNWWDKSILPSCHFMGEVSGIWDCETITIDGDILIPEGDTLIITEAVDRVLISGSYQIKVEGVLLAIGAEREAEIKLDTDYIKFQGENWKGIFFNNLNNSDVGTSIIENCRFDYADKMDMTYQGGGAIAIYNSDNVKVKHSLFYANSARYGGAMYIKDSNPYIEDCYFELNGKERGQNGTALTSDGGALFIENSNPYLHKLQFINNYSTSSGGAMVIYKSSITMSNILLAENETEGMGGAIQVTSDINGALLKIVNMTSVNNVSKRNGGGTIHTHGENTELEVINSIMYGNTKVELYVEGKTPVITYSLIEGDSGKAYFGTGCIDKDPLLDANYRLSTSLLGYSPAIDAGHPDSLDAVLSELEGKGSQRADMGYYGGRYSEMPVGIDDNETASQIPNKYELLQNYPNPFNPSTTIQFALPKAGVVSLKIYNILGEEVAELINREMNAGFQSVNFDASHLSSGLYMYRIKANNFVDVKKMLLLK